MSKEITPKRRPEKQLKGIQREVRIRGLERLEDGKKRRTPSRHITRP